MVQGYDGAYYSSDPDSGYSVDNLPPFVPAPFVAQYAAGVTQLHWNPNTEADLAGYRLYRGTTPGFTADAAHFLTARPDTGYADPAGMPFYYELTAVDVHGNESRVASVTPQGTLGVGGAAAGLALAPPSPNPAHTRALVSFSLPAAGPVSLALYDPAGRRVRTLADGPRAAGTYSLAVPLTRDDGTNLSPGLYFVRLEAGGARIVRRLAVVL
jgi:hypothetical protein